MARSLPAIRLTRIATTVALSLATCVAAVAAPTSGVDRALAQGDDGCNGLNCGDQDPPQPPVEDPVGREGSFQGGAAVMSPDGDVVDSGEGSSCPGCMWDLSRTCEVGGAGTCQEQAGCVDPDTGEPTNQLWTVWLTTPEHPRWEMGTICLGEEDGLVTPADVGEQVQDAWLEYVPEQRPSVQPPAGRTLVNLPTYFHSGQPAEMPTTTIPILDFQIQLTARGEWEWTFEPGVTKTFDTPGSHWNDPEPREVQYTYGETGDRRVTLNTLWWGSFRVGEYGPYDIETPASQGPYELDLEVTEAKSVLTR